MKQLYLNNKRVVLSDDTYFPFTQKVSDVEDVSIIGLLATKSVKIPICPANDEIFGYIADITRVIIGTNDDKIGISFNQIKKCTYTLYSNSEIISTGIIRIVNITETNYEIELYDALIDKIETLRGDESTGAGFLSELDIIKNNDTVFSVACTADNIISNLFSVASEVKPCFNIKEYDSNGEEVRVTYQPTSGLSYINTMVLDKELTPIRFRALKGYELDYAVSVATVIRSINYKYDVITYDGQLNAYFRNLYLNAGSPKITPSRTTSTESGDTLTTYTISGEDFSITPTVKSTTAISMSSNGKYKIRIPIDITLTPDEPTTFFSSWNGVNYSHTSNDGVKIGEFYITINISGYNYPLDKTYKSLSQLTKINLYKGVNTTITSSGGLVTGAVISDYIDVTLDYYPDIAGVTLNTIEFDFQRVSAFFYDVSYDIPSDSYINTYQSHTIASVVEDISVEYESTDFRTGDMLTGQSLFPKISIHEFIITLAKMFNLDLSVVSGKIHMKPKEYIETPEIPIIDAITKMEVPIFNFSKLVLTSEINESDEYKNYEKVNKKKYGQQIINTGYNIKRTTKTINFPYATSGLLIDYDDYAYGAFAEYANGGYSKGYFGVTTGLEDKLTFGFINEIQQPMCISNDTPYEGALVGDSLTPTGVKFVMNNTLMKVSQSAPSTFKYPTVDAPGGTRLVQSYYTLSPYKFNSSGVITDSLEMNKPDYNFAGIFDANYPETATLYQSHHKNITQDIYNANTHIITVKMFIDGVIDIYKIYNIRNSMYVIYELPEYDPTIPNLYEVKFIRVNDIDNYTTTYDYPLLYAPTVVTYSATNILYNGFFASGRLTSTGGDEMIEAGILLTTGSTTPTISTNLQKIITQASPYVLISHTFTNLTPSTSYNYRAYAINSIGVSYGDVQTASTVAVPALPTFRSAGIDTGDYGHSGSTGYLEVEMEILSEGTSSVTQRGFCWCLSSDGVPTITDTNSTNGSGAGLFTHTITGLTIGETYNIRAYATNTTGTAYSSQYWYYVE